MPFFSSVVRRLRYSVVILRTGVFRRALSSQPGARSRPWSWIGSVVPFLLGTGMAGGLYGVYKNVYDKRNQFAAMQAVHAGARMTDKNKERTFIMVKPDGVQRGLVGEIIKRFEQKGFKLVALKFVHCSEDHLKIHYADLRNRPYFPGLVKFVSSGPVVAMVWEGVGIVNAGRAMIGQTDPADSNPGTVRFDFCVHIVRTVIHGSDSVESADKEIALWFDKKELVDWTPNNYKYIYEN